MKNCEIYIIQEKKRPVIQKLMRLGEKFAAELVETLFQLFGRFQQNENQVICEQQQRKMCWRCQGREEARNSHREREVTDLRNMIFMQHKKPNEVVGCTSNNFFSIIVCFSQYHLVGKSYAWSRQSWICQRLYFS